MIPNGEKEGWHYFAVKKAISFITRNKGKTLHRFLLFKFSFFLCNKN